MGARESLVRNVGAVEPACGPPEGGAVVRQYLCDVVSDRARANFGGRRRAERDGVVRGLLQTVDLSVERRLG